MATCKFHSRFITMVMLGQDSPGFDTVGFLSVNGFREVLRSGSLSYAVCFQSIAIID